MELGIGILIGIALAALAVFVGKKYDIPTSVEGITPFPVKGWDKPHMAQIIKRKSPEQEIEDMLK